MSFDSILNFQQAMFYLIFATLLLPLSFKIGAHVTWMHLDYILMKIRRDIQ